jgi:homoserine dehydrogenase
MKSFRFAIVGLGNIGRRLLELITIQRELLANGYGLAFRAVGASDSTGAALDSDGLDMPAVVELKQAGQGIAGYPTAGRPAMSATQMLAQCDMDLLVEVSPTNLKTGEPGLSCIRATLKRGIPVVTANKGPLVLAYQELVGLAREKGATMLFSGTVAGALPVVNIGTRDLNACSVERVEGIFNSTTNYILCRMEDEGLSFQEALAGAQEAGIAERDPTLDIDGWDAANKLVIVANSVLNRPTKLQDLEVTGIRDISRDDLVKARGEGKAIKLLATAVRRGGDFELGVRPTALPRSHPLAGLRLWDMGVIYHTDTMGTLTAIIEEQGAMPTAAAVLRDMINTFR